MKRGDQQSDFPPGELPSGGTSRSRAETQNNNGVPDDDPALLNLEAALRGDIGAFAKLFESYRQRLYALCLGRLSDHSLAEDVVQEVFVRAFMSLPNYQHRNLFWQWLSTIAIRMCIDLQRSRSLTHYSEDIGAAVDSAANGGAFEGQTDSALDAVIASERRAELWESLRVLPKRHRRVFLLYVLDGWSCAEIAEAEGISVHAVHHLLFRARRKMQATAHNGTLALVPLPFIWLRSRLQEAEERIRMALGLIGDRLGGAGTAAVSLGVLAVIATTVNGPAESFEKDNVRSGEQVVSITQAQPSQRASSNLVNAVGTEAMGGSQQPVPGPANSLVDDMLNPNQSATPENSSFYSITPSPNYENDHTLLAVGRSSSAFVLFVSHDGGGSWQPRPSRLLQGSSVVLPPNFPQDGRIFVSRGILGLQQSDDGGEIFRTVSPVSGNIAISPTFGREDSITGGGSKILIGGKTVFEYDAVTGATRPALPSLPPSNRGYSSIAFSPSYHSDSTIFVAEADVGASYRCSGLLCDVMPLPTAGPLFRFSPQCDQAGLAYVFTPWKLLVSHDQAQTFGKVEFPLEFQPPFNSSRSILDVAPLCNKFSDPAIFASFIDDSSFYSQLPSGIYRSFDAGRSWNRASIDLPGFHAGAASKLIVTPTGRLLATGLGYGYGIACSADLGQTWRPRCPPEH